jgi:hypothetical protein
MQMDKDREASRQTPATAVELRKELRKLVDKHLAAAVSSCEVDGPLWSEVQRARCIGLKLFG